MRSVPVAATSWVRVGSGHGPLDRGDGRLVEDVFDPAAGSFTDRGIRDGPLDQLDPVQSLLQVHPAPSGEIVEDAHAGTLGDQAIHQVGTDEPGASRNKRGGIPHLAAESVSVRAAAPSSTSALKNGIVRRSPCGKGTLGSQPSTARAIVISGCRTLGSS